MTKAESGHVWAGVIGGELADAQLSDERLRMAAQAARFGVYDADLIKGTLYWSPEMKAIVGYPADSAPPRPGTVPDFIHPDDRERVQQMLTAAFDPAERGQVVHEHRIIWPDGTVRWVQVKGAVRFRDVEGVCRPARSTGVMIDITALKQAEERERAARADAERASALAQLFVGVLSHDLRTPLAAVEWAGAIILEASEPATVRTAARRLLRSAGRMHRLINQILDVTRIREGGGLPCAPSAVDIAEVVRSVREELTEPERTMPVVATGDTRGWWDEDRLTQVFSNLLGNARAHSPPGVLVTTSVDGSDAECVVVAVRNPATIPAQALPGIFEPFRQASPKPGRGIGLGLYISKEIIAAHGGTIEVSSTDAEGTCFTIRLPRRYLS